MTKAHAPSPMTLEATILREVQERLDRHLRTLRQPFGLSARGLRSDGAMYVVPIAADNASAPEEAVRVIAAFVENEMEEEYPGLRLMLMPEFGKRARTPRVFRRSSASKAKTKRIPSRRKGR